jgi:hypothetical protein
VDGKLHLHNLTDLGSRYRLPPLASHCLPCGEEVAGHLHYLFDRFDPPLFCKRDNGGNLNHVAVNHVLEQALVIPINSPPYQAPYNGAIEHTQGEFKSYLDRWNWKAGSADRLVLLAETAAHDLNHNPRRCLGSRTACRAYFGGPSAIPDESGNPCTDGSRSWLPKYPPRPESSSSFRWHGGWRPSSGW